MTARTHREQKIETIEDRLRRVIALHFDRREGTPFWIKRAGELGIAVERDIRRVDDLAVLGEMTPDDLSGRPLTDFIPRRLVSRLDRFIVGQTGGTTGAGTWTAYSEDEFHEAFVLPFVAAAGYVGFPAGESWLYVGPSGPHIIGKVARHLAAALGSADPFSVDFDSRWAKKLPDDSFARRRYAQHVVDQAMAVVEAQHIGVLFATPAVLERLAEAMAPEQRIGIRGVHYGGMALSPQQLERFQLEWFPNAVHLSGYGNTLFGCCLELSTTASRPLDYYPYGNRLLLQPVNDCGEPVPDGEIGTVSFTRLDESMLIIRMRERDQASRVALPDDSPEGYTLPGLRNPQPHVSTTVPVSLGLY